MMKLFLKVISKVKKLMSLVYEVFQYNNFFTTIYSQEGEEVLLRRVFDSHAKGFYVDIGAHHPIRFSNTYYFYKMGWCGINVEPNPDAFKIFQINRKKDINLNYGVAKKETTLKYYMFNEPALNTFNPAVFKERLKLEGCEHRKTLDIEVLPLSKLLDQFMPLQQQIDFLSIDVEGLDLEVLQSNDWSRYRPKWVLVEQLNMVNIEKLDFEIHLYMTSLNYELFAKLYNTLFYKDKGVII